MSNDTYAYPGHINLQDVKLISMRGIVIDLIASPGFLVELNIIEDIFSNFIRGQATITDSSNLTSLVPFTGEEYLYVKASTPGIPAGINKLFRIYSITNREVIKETHTQLYQLNFCSLEAIADVTTPLFLPFEGAITDVVSKIFTDFLARPISIDYLKKPYTMSSARSQLYLVETGFPKNHVKFISSGWNPAYCLNWLAARSIPSNSLSCSFLFYETTKGFFFTNLDAMLNNDPHPNVYTYSPIKYGSTVPPERMLHNIISFSNTKLFDHLGGALNGHFSSRVYALDLLNKKFTTIDHNYFDEFYKHSHIGGPTAVLPLLNVENAYNTSVAQHTKISVMNPKLFSNFSNNVNDQLPNIYGRRMALLQSLRDVIYNITIYGKTDLQVGIKIFFDHPEIMFNESAGEIKADKHYSGFYLVTCLRHKIQMIQGKPNHTIAMEVVKDTLENRTIK